MWCVVVSSVYERVHECVCGGLPCSALGLGWEVILGSVEAEPWLVMLDSEPGGPHSDSLAERRETERDI